MSTIHPSWTNRNERPRRVCRECREVFTSSRRRVVCSAECESHRRSRRARKRRGTDAPPARHNPSAPVDWSAVRAGAPVWLWKDLS